MKLLGFLHQSTEVNVQMGELKELLGGYTWKSAQRPMFHQASASVVRLSLIISVLRPLPYPDCFPLIAVALTRFLNTHNQCVAFCVWPKPECRTQDEKEWENTSSSRSPWENGCFFHILMVVLLSYWLMLLTLFLNFQQSGFSNTDMWKWRRKAFIKEFKATF